MCGIFFSCLDCHQNEISLDGKLIDLLKKRGPDSLEQITLSIKDYIFRFIGCVLSLRGDEIVKQPNLHNGNIFLWNGEMYNIGDSRVEGDKQSDTQYIFRRLELCNGDEHLIFKLIGSIEGPFVFVYWNSQFQCLYFGRDVIGRRSLCWKRIDKPFQLTLSSVCSPGESGWEEVPAIGIYGLSFKDKVPTIKLINWYQNAAGSIGRYEISLPSPIKQTLNSQCPESSMLPNDFSISDKVIDKFTEILSDSICKRITNFNQLCQNCVHNRSRTCHHSSIGILFSGGLDSSVLALLACNYISQKQSIDLLNVAFSSDAPDRLNGIEAYKEIKKMRPDIKLNLVKIDVSLEELKTCREAHIKHLIKPLNTVLDDSIACAVWFAARGQGYIESYQPYNCPARVVLLGMGADEQLAGYSRHRNKFQESGWKGLIDEIGKELTGISKRNLGRDDRIISDHEREARFPYLDERLINYLNSLAIWEKANLTLERGKGEKLLLRLVARKLGLTKVSGYWKRAIQFGSKIAHLEKRKEKGSDQCDRL